LSDCDFDSSIQIAFSWHNQPLSSLNYTSIFLTSGLKETTEQLVKEKLEGKDKLTPWEEFIEKKKDKKKQKKTKGKQVRSPD
jgi:hypothetical protein